MQYRGVQSRGLNGCMALRSLWLSCVVLGFMAHKQLGPSCAKENLNSSIIENTLSCAVDCSVINDV